MKRLVYNLKQLPRVAARRLLNDCLHTERLSSDEIATINWQRRIKLLHEAARTPFYRQRFAKIGLEPDDVKCENDWEKIPVLTRQDIQEHLREMVQEGIARDTLGITTTGGSTGQPLKLYRPKNIPYDAFTVRMLGWWGVNMWDNSAYIFRHGYSGWRKGVNDLMWWPTKRAFLNAGNMDDARCEKFFQRLKVICPELIVGYVGAVACFAEYLAKTGQTLPFPVKAVWTTSAPLPEPLRHNLESVFRAPVYSQYGCCEVGHLAAECSCREGMHIHYDWRHLEIADEQGHLLPVGEEGNILISDLLSTEVPVIRYALGDRGKMMTGACACGINLPRMAPVKGRVSEAFPMPDGSRLSGDYLTTIFDRYPDSIRGFRVQQKKDYSILVEYVVRDENGIGQAVDDARENLVKTTKGQVPIQFRSVAEIPHDRGKTRYVTTEVR